MLKSVYNYTDIQCTVVHVHVHGEADKPAITGQCCFELVTSHQQGMHVHV